MKNFSSLSTAAISSNAVTMSPPVENQKSTHMKTLNKKIMKKMLQLKVMLFVTIMLFAFSAMAQTTKVRLYAADATPVGAIAVSNVRVIGTGAWQNNQEASTGKMELYLPLTSLGSFTIDNIASLEFSTQKVLPAGSNLDFFWTIYTNPYTGGYANWYGQRLTSEPMYYNGYNAPYNVWTSYQTAAGANQMTFFDSNHS